VNRLKTYVADGTIPNSRLYAGDMNALQDAVAALSDATQTIKANAYSIHDDALQLVKYGTLEARLSGALRTDGILRGLSGLIAGAYTTTARNAITAPPYGLVILNTTTNAYEWNSGTSDSPNWKPFGGFTPSGSGGTKVVNADVDAAAAIAYSKLALAGHLVNADIATGAAIGYAKLNLAGSVVNSDIASGAAIGIAKLAGYPGDAAKFLAGDASWKTIATLGGIKGSITFENPVDDDGDHPSVTINQGTGFDAAPLDGHSLHVEFDVAFADTPLIFTTMYGVTTAAPYGQSASGFNVNLNSQGGGFSTGQFSFWAIMP
jgi:hypothetical protein